MAYKAFCPPHGFDIMQIDNPLATARQLRGCTDNVSAGVALYGDRLIKRLSKLQWRNRGAVFE